MSRPSLLLTRDEAIVNLRLYRASAFAGPAASVALDCVAQGADPRMLCLVIERSLDGGADFGDLERRDRRERHRARVRLERIGAA